MRILYDGFIYDFQQYGGINRYFNEIIQRLPPEDTPLLSSYLGPRPFWPEHPGLKVVRSRPFAKLPALAFLGRSWMSLRTACTGADLLHPTYYFQHTSAGLKRGRRPLVITVHDMIHELFADEIDPDRSVAQAKRRCIEQADAILCNSAHTRQDLLSFFPAVADRTHVTPLASSMTVNTEQARSLPKPERPYFLYVGGRDGYKNFTLLLEAWARFSPRCPEVQLRVVGSPWLSREREALARHPAAASIVHQGKASDDQLALLYHEALALVYPSRYEGFGIPPLEAMRCGTAVISASTSSLPEVGGDAPLYFDPSQPEALAEQLQRLAGSADLRQECIRRGRARAALFSWDQTAKLTFDVYRQLSCP